MDKFGPFHIFINITIVPCEWSEWTVGECSKECGGGTHTKTRTEKAKAEHGGEECSAEHSTIEESCNVFECKGKVSGIIYFRNIFRHVT